MTQGTSPHNTFQINGLGPGEYTFVLTDVNGCRYTTVQTLSTTCNMMYDMVSNGTTVMITNVTGIPPFTYSTVGVAPVTIDDNYYTFTNLSTGDHFITVTDVNGCEKTEGVNIKEELIFIKRQQCNTDVKGFNHNQIGLLPNDRYYSYRIFNPNWTLADHPNTSWTQMGLGSDIPYYWPTLQDQVQESWYNHIQVREIKSDGSGDAKPGGLYGEWNCQCVLTNCDALGDAKCKCDEDYE